MQIKYEVLQSLLEQAFDEGYNKGISAIYAKQEAEAQYVANRISPDIAQKTESYGKGALQGRL